MRCKPAIALCFLITITSGLTAQEKPLFYKNQLKFSPLRLVDPMHGGIEMSYERRYSRNFSTELAAGYLTNVFFKNAYKNHLGARFAIEQKYFLRRHPQMNRYLSLEAVRQFISFRSAQYFVHDSTATTPQFNYVDTVTIKRKTTIINLRLGRQLNIGKFVAEISLGFGVRFRAVRHFDKIYPDDKLSPPRHPNINYSANSEKNDAAVNIPFNIRLGFAF